MSKFVPGAVPQANLDIANAPYWGGEFAFYLSQQPAVLAGEIDISASGVGLWVPHNAATLASAGTDLQIVAKTPIASSAALAVVLAVVLAALDNSTVPVAVTANASFVPPARAVNQSFNFQRGIATDLTLNPRVTHSTQRASSSTVATITSPLHGYVTGQHVTTTNFGVAGYNVTNVAITVTDPNTFTYACTAPLEVTTADVTGTITPVGIGTQFTSITGLTSVANGGVNQVLRVYQLPAISTFELIEPTAEIDFNTKSRQAKGIDSAMEADAYVKLGKTHPGELTVAGKFKGFVESGSAARYDGQRCTAMLIGLKEGQQTGDVLVFAQYVGTIKPKLPEGDGEATTEMTGKFVEHLFFFAP